jgi:hypothetical protein
VNYFSQIFPFVFSVYLIQYPSSIQTQTRWFPAAVLFFPVKFQHAVALPIASQALHFSIGRNRFNGNKFHAFPTR